MNTERRNDRRFDDQSLVFVEVESAQPDATASAKLALARTLDISSRGMQIATKESLLPERILRIFVDNGEEYPLTLVGEVKWTRQVGNEYQSGVELYPSRETAQSQWADKVLKHGLREAANS
ncbi:PilZ domain-containing protein [Litorivivens sp.]